jgi:hypothetical protein
LCQNKRKDFCFDLQRKREGRKKKKKKKKKKKEGIKGIWLVKTLLHLLMEYIVGNSIGY